MPARSTPFQAIVRMVQEHFSPPGSEWRESELITDRRGIERELDLVCQGFFAGEQVMLAAEVTEKKRAADILWVDGMIEKHSHLPTSLLLLISKNGFTASALRAVDCQSGKVRALAPVINTDDHGDPRVSTLRTGSSALTIGRFAATLAMDANGGMVESGDQMHQASVFDEAGTFRGSFHDLVTELAHFPDIRMAIGIRVLANDPTDRRYPFSLTIPFYPAAKYFFRNDLTGNFHAILGVSMSGHYELTMKTMTLAHFTLGSYPFAMADDSIDDMPTAWAAFFEEDRTIHLRWELLTTPRAQMAATVRPDGWRRTEGRADPPALVRARKFPDLDLIDLEPLLKLAEDAVRNDTATATNLQTIHSNLDGAT